MSIKVGNTVKLKSSVIHKCPDGRDNNKTAIVQQIINGDELRMNRDLAGCIWWNSDDVEVLAQTANTIGVD